MTATVTAPTMWAALTAAQQQALLYSTDPAVSVGVELLDFNLNVVRDISRYVDTTQGDIEWQAAEEPSRDLSITLSQELNWGIDLIRVYRVITDKVSGLSARVDRGTFVVQVPDQELGDMVLIDGVPQLVWDVTGQDRTSLLDREPGYSYVITAVDGSGNPVTVLAALAATYQAAGLPGFLIDSSASASVLPSDQVWPMISVGDDDTSSTDLTTTVDVSGDPLIAANADNGDSATWRQIINDLHALINYRAVWSDEDGYLRSTPYADPSLRAPSQTIDPPALPSPLAVDRKVTSNPLGTNRWIFVWSNMPVDSNGNQVTPTTGNGGIYQVDNVNTGRSSQSARNNLVFPTTFNLTAATADDFQAQANQQVASDMQVVTTYSFSLRPTWVVFGHFDVVTVNDAGAGKVQLTSWTESFSNDDVEVVATST